MLYQDKLQAKENPNEKKISCFIYKSKEPYYPNHCHTHLELIYIIDGSMKFFLNGKTKECKKGDLIFVPILSPHSISNVSNESCHHMILQISLDFLDDNYDFSEMLFPGLNLQENTSFNIREYSSIKEVLLEMQHLCGKKLYNATFRGQEYSYQERDIVEELSVKGMTFKLFSLLLEKEIIILSENAENFQDIHELSQIQTVLEKMINHPEENLSLEDAAEIASMSYFNFSRTFKRLLGYNFIDYKNLLRVRYAEELLYETDKSITEIAELLNFGNLSYFNRTFKKYNQNNPSDYRRNLIEQNKTK